MRGQKGQTYHDWVGTESWTEGQETEASFGELLEERYPGARPATLPEQYMHIDWVCSAGSIDVKALKRKNGGLHLAGVQEQQGGQGLAIRTAGLHSL